MRKVCAVNTLFYSLLQPPPIIIQILEDELCLYNGERINMFLGIDIGGTNIKFGVAGENYKIIKAYCIPTEKDRGDKYLVNTIIQKAKEIYDEFPYEKIGVGTPGTVDFEKGICVKGANLPYNNTPIKDITNTNNTGINNTKLLIMIVFFRLL